ncbi:MAG: glycerol dehydrogenase [Deltaproteobacteria bacterium]|nr:glycerol dehydrogenase [Deltaproteobacteria bacterium]
MTGKKYDPQDYFSGDLSPERSPKVFIAPHRYIQGENILDHLGRYIGVINSMNPAVLITKGGLKRIGNGVTQNLKKRGIEPAVLIFGGECSEGEISRHVNALKGLSIDSVIAIGGGKCLDAGKCIAHRMSVPAVICPTVASTDAPCSALSAIYKPDGSFDYAWHYAESPSIILVDTAVIAKSPPRHLVAGMGDAIATYYEARTCFLNPKARTSIGARPTVAAYTIAETGAKLILENGVEALDAVNRSVINEALERVIEANTLLSGIGFESGGLAASHGVAMVLPVIPRLHTKYLHGEMVAVGVLIQNCLEGNIDEARRLTKFFAEVGLPAHLGQIDLDPEEYSEDIDLVINAAMNIFFIHHEPFEVTPEKLRQAFKDAHEIGIRTVQDIGDEAYNRLHE